MAFNITFNKKGESKIIESGEVKSDLKLQWEKNSIDKSVLNNINRSPRVLSGERVGIEDEQNNQNNQNEILEIDAEIEINGSNFITDESQKILLNPIVTNIDSGNIIDDDRYTVNWYLNDDLLDVPDIFELNTTELDNESNNIIKLEVLIDDKILVDKASILKYLGFVSSSTNNNGTDDGTDDDGQKSEGKVLEVDDGILIRPRGDGFKVGEEITFASTDHKTDKALWDFGDGNGASGITVNHKFNNAGIYTIETRIIKTFSIDNPKAKIKIVE